MKELRRRGLGREMVVVYSFAFVVVWLVFGERGFVCGQESEILSQDNTYKTIGGIFLPCSMLRLVGYKNLCKIIKWVYIFFFP